MDRVEITNEAITIWRNSKENVVRDKPTSQEAFLVNRVCEVLGHYVELNWKEPEPNCFPQRFMDRTCSIQLVIPEWHEGGYKFPEGYDYSGKKVFDGSQDGSGG